MFSLPLLLKERHLRSVELDTSKDAPLLAVRKPSSSWRCVGLAYNAAENAVLLQSRTEEGGSYELYRLPVAGAAAAGPAGGDEAAQCKRGLGSDAVWVGRNKFAVLERGGAVVVRTAENEVVRRHTAPAGTVGLLAATSGRVLCRTEEGAVLLDLGRPAGEEVVGRAALAQCRAAVWGGRKETPIVALIGKHGVAMCTRELQPLCSVQETVKVRRGMRGGEMAGGTSHCCCTGQERGVGREFGHARVHDGEPHQVSVAQRRRRHHPHAGRAAVPGPRPRQPSPPH